MGLAANVRKMHVLSLASMPKRDSDGKFSFASSQQNTPEILNVVADCSNTSKVYIQYTFRVFQWKETDLSADLQKFVQICNNFLNGNTDAQKFIEELTSSLE